MFDDFVVEYVLVIEVVACVVAVGDVFCDCCSERFVVGFGGWWVCGAVGGDDVTDYGGDFCPGGAGYGGWGLCVYVVWIHGVDAKRYGTLKLDKGHRPRKQRG